MRALPSVVRACRAMLQSRSRASLNSPERVADALEVKLVQGIGQIDARLWDACAGRDQPFLSHAFLSALEDSGSATPRTGCLPLHLVVEAGGGLIGRAPLYLTRPPHAP